jgi:polyisoprenyl-phosphate glycosyltransferase
MNNPVYSLIFPVYNEEMALPKLKAALVGILRQLNDSYEIIFIDDGSKDSTPDILEKYSIENSNFKVITFSRNFGHQAALAAGLNHASGDAVIIMDADLQDPVELLQEFIGKWKEGYKVVYGIRKARDGESYFKKFTAGLFYKIIYKFSDIEIPQNVSDFRLLDKEVVEHMRNFKESHLFWRGLASWVGFKQTGIEFIRKPRVAGTTHYSFRKMLKFAIDGITSFSIKPLKLSTYLGFIIAFISFIFGIWTIIAKIIYGNTLAGWASLMTAVLFFGGIQLIMIGLLGEYVGRTYEESKKRPIYIIKDKVNLA